VADDQALVPAVGDVLVDRDDARVLDLLADRLERLKGGGHFQAQLLEERLVVDEGEGDGLVPDGLAVQLAVVADRLEARRGQEVRPFRAGHVQAVLGRVELAVYVQRARLNPEDVGRLARVELGLQKVVMLVRRYDLELDPGAGLFKELLRQVLVGLVGPAAGNLHGQRDVFGQRRQRRDHQERANQHCEQLLHGQPSSKD